ncbi:DUF5131 family protein [Rubrivirga marina]|uniref:Uncharacterized protein n=1 Tax=Rubrivirga marina TaxID=1196024 RepID=A0A271IWI2_9BACT|nr:DUF5131 family protein [Rubrivirga marina]PAP75075.1 hypothetical protein BSZ37_00720 [Rubrivirga marina]
MDTPTDTNTPTAPIAPDGLTDDDRVEHDRLVADIKAADRDTLPAMVRVGVAILALMAFRSLRPRHERARPWARVAEEDLEMSESRSYQLKDLAVVDRALREAGVEPVTVVSHAVALSPLRDDPDRIAEAARLGRAMAEAEATAPAARHFAAARFRVLNMEEPGEQVEGDVALTHNDESERDPWPWGALARDRFTKVPRVDRDAVVEALTLASLSEDVTPELVGEAAEVVRAERVEDGGRGGRPVVVGVAVGIVEVSRRRLLFDDHPELIEDIEILEDEGLDARADDAVVDEPYVPEGPTDRPPLLVVVPVGLCPDALLDAHNAHAAVVGRAEVVVELGELHEYGGPVERVGDELVLDVDAVRRAARAAGIRKTFNNTGKLVGWAMYSTNGSTGCTHRCGRRFCYASDLALKFYPQAFVPTLHPARLDAFDHTPVPDPDRSPEWAREWFRSVFYGSMTDIMNGVFPDWWIQAVIDEIAAHPEWHVFVLTKLAGRLGDFVWPPNVMVGVTVTTQSEVRAAAAGLAAVRGGGGKWVSVEPYLGPIDPAPLLDAEATFFAVGGQSATRWDGERQPDPAWVRDLVGAVWARGGHVYIKDNTDFRGHIPFPGTVPFDAPPPFAAVEPDPEPDRAALDRAPVRPKGPRSAGRPA